jgi:aryl-alcohol dehydrogenase-like predicted oxidoreductase
VVPYSLLGKGILTGTVRSPADLADSDSRRLHTRFAPDNLRNNVKLAEQIWTLAAEKGVTPAQLALASLHRKGPDVVPIPGASRAERVEENAGALSVQLTPHEVAELERSAPVGAAAGERSI